MNSILIVGDPSSVDFVNQSYGDLAPVTFASSVMHAESLIAKNQPTIVIGTLAFDESRFLCLLPELARRRIKTVVVDCPYTLITDEALEVVKAYAKDMGIAAWWDMRQTVAKDGIEVAGKEIRAIIQSLLAACLASPN